MPGQDGRGVSGRLGRKAVTGSGGFWLVGSVKRWLKARRERREMEAVYDRRFSLNAVALIKIVE